MNDASKETHKPHTAVISVQLEVHSLLDTGECSGRVVNREVLDSYDIKDAFLATVNGITLDDCLKKLKVKLEELNNDNVESE
jgi:hypothetical protein